MGYQKHHLIRNSFYYLSDKNLSLDPLNLYLHYYQVFFSIKVHFFFQAPMTYSVPINIMSYLTYLVCLIIDISYISVRLIGKCFYMLVLLVEASNIRKRILIILIKHSTVRKHLVLRRGSLFIELEFINLICRVWYLLSVLSFNSRFFLSWHFILDIILIINE